MEELVWFSSETFIQKISRWQWHGLELGVKKEQDQNLGIRSSDVIIVIIIMWLSEDLYKI